MKIKLLLLIILIFTTIRVFAEWEQLFGPPGGQIRSILYDGTTSGNIYRRSSSGGNWTLVSTTDFNSCVGSLSSNNSVLFAGTHGTKLYSSMDGGANWSQPCGGYWPSMRIMIRLKFINVNLKEMYATTLS